ncbi:MAG: hypothetical protein KatS3mg083_646 [Candidatus Dojkabacteria bacterium]|nr:MAG: hypothetical protein KatS3mg083_646 [Candidatus Dojkabacteria bacterium]
MKRFLLSLVFVAMFFFEHAYCQVSELPDTVQFVTVDGDTVTVSLDEFKAIAEKVGYIVGEIKKSPPKQPFEWLGFLISLIMSAGGVTFLTQLVKVGKSIVNVLGLKMGIYPFVLALSAIFAGVLTYFSIGSLEYDVWLATSSGIFTVATGIYLLFVKKRKNEQ